MVRRPLSRGSNQDGTAALPDSFLQIMESNGTIVELDMLIFQQVCEFIGEKTKNLYIKNTGTAQSLYVLAKKYAIPPELIEFALTETISLEEFESAKALIDQLRGRRYRVSIDEFGSGYAGINIWKELDSDFLKLDKNFLSAEEPVQSKNSAIVPKVINIAKKLGIGIICEGVETKAQCQFLVWHGCTGAQGYFFRRLCPKNSFMKSTKSRTDTISYKVPFHYKTCLCCRPAFPYAPSSPQAYSRTGRSLRRSGGVPGSTGRGWTLFYKETPRQWLPPWYER